MSVQQRLDVADIDGGPVGFAAASDQELREVVHRGEPGLESGVPARVGAGTAGTITTGLGSRNPPKRICACSISLPSTCTPAHSPST